ncbi:molybdopterin-dependent oxidoreductase [[Brevibacterium] frigoritolerans]|uniref:Molybdopterin-dependent oxidoreductase n=1 Tax=Peribacillus frigoritolerans TaxID=450367 RepID=A0A941J5C7_9BACI|nr:molybdopterin-dependent oxidoreductase [Peribacillus frigoritolerans]
MGTSLFLHGCGFTGSGERDHIKAKVKLVKSKDDQVSLKISNSDMGQGILTTLCKIVSKELNLPFEDILYPYPDTKRGSRLGSDRSFQDDDDCRKIA